MRERQHTRWRRAVIGFGALLALVVALSAFGTPALAATTSTADTPDAPSTPANFDVSIDRVELNPPDISPLGDSTSPLFEVSYTVTNTGGTADTQTITLEASAPDIGSVAVDRKQVSLRPGERYSGVFSGSDLVSSPTLGTDCISCLPEEVTFVVSSEDDVAKRTVPVDGPSNPATFTVAGLQTNSPVTAGEDLTAEVQVTNTGDESGTQRVTVEAGRLGSDEATLSLRAGASATRTFTLATGTGDDGTYTLSASTANDSASTGVEVRADGGGGGEAYFDVSITDTTVETPDIGDPILMSSSLGTSVRVDYVVANTGNVSGTQSVTFTVDQTKRDSETISLGPGASQSGTFSASILVFEPATTQAVIPSPPYETNVTVAVSSEDDTATETVSVGPGDDPATFEIEGVETNEPTAGEDLLVELRVTNTGDATGTRTVAVDAGALGSASAPLTLAGGESTVQTFTIGTNTADAGSYRLEATTGDDSATVPFAVKPADGGEAEFDVSIDDARLKLPDPGPVPVPTDGEIGLEFGVVVDYTVTNTGNASDTQQITVAVEGTTRERTTVSLGPGENESNTFSDSLAVYHGDDSGIIAGAAGAAEMYDPLERLPVLPEPPVVPELTVSVSSEDDTATANISAGDEQDPPRFVVEAVKTDSPVTAGEDLEVAVTVTNTGDVVDSQQVTVSAGALGTSSRLQLLAPGSSATTQFTLDTSEGEAGNYTVRASTADDSASASATVRPAADGEANFDVSIEDTTVSPPEEPGPVVWPASGLRFTVAVDYAVENTGNASGSQPVTLAVEGDTENETGVRLGAGERATGTLSAVVSVSDVLLRPQSLPEPPYTPAVTVSVSSEDDTARERVTLEPPATDPPRVVVDSVATNGPVTAGEELSVAVQLTNTGDAVASQAVSVDAGALGSESTLLLLRANESVVQRFTFQTSAGDAGTYTLDVSTGDDTATATATVEPLNDSEATFEVSIDDTRVNVSSPVLPGPVPSVDASLDLEVTLTAAYTVENTGGANDTQTVSFSVDGEREDTSRVTLEPGETASGAFTETLSMSDIERPDRPCIVPHGGTCLPHVTVAVSTDDDRATEDITIGPGGTPLPTLTDSPPVDTDGDELHEDIRGDGTTDLLDVQALFENLDNPALEENAGAFRFSGAGDGVSVLDVQALFNDLPEASA